MGKLLSPFLKNEKDMVFLSVTWLLILSTNSKSYGRGKFNVTQSTVSDDYCILRVFRIPLNIRAMYTSAFWVPCHFPKGGKNSVGSWPLTGFLILLFFTPNAGR